MRKVYLINPRILPNKTFSWTKAYRYAKLMEEGVEFPPVKVHKHREHGYLTFNDGRHRVAAAKLLDKPLKVKQYVQ